MLDLQCGNDCVHFQLQNNDSDLYNLLKMGLWLSAFTMPTSTCSYIWHTRNASYTLTLLGPAFRSFHSAEGFHLMPVDYGSLEIAKYPGLPVSQLLAHLREITPSDNQFSPCNPRAFCYSGPKINRKKSTFVPTQSIEFMRAY